MRFDRQSGVLLHVSALPGPHGIGDLGAGARAFVDFLEHAEQSLWQVCPLGPTSPVHGNSPYQSFSAFAGNPLFVDLRGLVEAGWLTDEEIQPTEPFPQDRVDYERVSEFKTERLRTAYERFEAAEDQPDGFDAFREREAHWLQDYTLFRALKTAHDGAAWTEWPADHRDRDPAALERVSEDRCDEIRYHAFVQWVFDRQWRDLVDYAHDNGVRLLGDLPIYVGADSADVWANPERFQLRDDGTPAAVAGVPPNPGDDGQRWGNPVYDWERLREAGYDWWLDRLNRTFDLVDIARLDHFKGFHEYWAIPADAAEPAAGEWRPGPGGDFFETVRDELGELPFVAEDLGFLDPGVTGLRDEFDLPGMRVAQYADWCEAGHMYQPMHFPGNTVGYTSTHDTDTVVGYYRDLSDRQRDCMQYNLGTDGDEIHWDLIEAVWNSDAGIAMTAMQDLLGLGSEARFNEPGTTHGNWTWRVTDEELDPDVSERLWEVTDRTLR